MAFLDWSDKFLTGINIIDTDHQNLFSIVNAIHEAKDSQTRAMDVEPMIMALSKYAKMHFEREEKIMRDYAFPGYVQHAEKHRSIIRRIQSRVDQYDSQRRDGDFEDLLSFAGNWLVSHVLKSDMEYVPYISGHLKALPRVRTL